MAKRRPNFFDQVIHNLLDLIFPRHCLGCGRERTWLCFDCLARLPRSYSPNEDKIFSVFEYGAPVVKQVIWRLKYKRGLELAEILAKPMHDVLLEELEDELITNAKIILIPAPLSPARLRSRGYNQAEELARQIAHLNPDQFEVRTDIIKKVKDTPTQVSIKNREARLKNLKNAFIVRSPTSNTSNQVIVIVDDVTTTGATIGEIRQLLTSQLKARHVYGLVVAHG